MASSSPSSDQQDHDRTGDDTGHPRHRRHHIDHLQVQVPSVVPNTTTSSCFTGCFRPSPSSSSSSSPGATHHHVNAHVHVHADRPASPSLMRLPTAWIRSFGSGKHTRRRSRDFQYDATSYARNFDEGGTDGEGDEETGNAAGDALKYRLFTSRLPTSPPALSPSGLGPGNGKGGTEPARQTGHDLDRND